MMSRTSNVSYNLIWGIVEKIVALIFPFIVRTIMIYTIGIQYTGLGSLFASLLNILSFAELGIGSALVFSMYRPVAEQDDEKICALLNFYRKCYRLIGAFILVCGLCLLPLLDHLVSGEVPDGISLHVLFCAYLFNTVIGYFLYAYRSSLFLAHQELRRINRVNAAMEVLKGTLQSTLLLIFHSYYLYVFVIPAITCASNLIVGWLSRKCYPQYVCRGKLDRTEIHGIGQKVGGLVLQKMGNIILTSADTIVISAYLGLRILGIYNGYYYVITALFGFLGIIYQAIIPSVGNSIVNETKEKNYRDFRKFQFLYSWIVIWWSACLLCLYQPFIHLWQGEENMLSEWMVVLLVMYFFTYKAGDMSGIYKEAIGMWWQGKFVPLISSAINLCLNLILIRHIGLPGIVISTIVSITFVNIPYGGWVLFHYYFASRKKYIDYIMTVFRYFVQAVLVSGATWLCCRNVPGGVVASILGRAAICLVIPNLLLLLLNFWNADFRAAATFLLCAVPEKFLPTFARRWRNEGHMERDR